MPVVTYGQLFIHRVNLTDFKAYYVAEGTPSHEVDATREVYAAGNSGIVRSPRKTDDLSYKLVEIPRADEEWLRESAGDLLLFRDPRGHMHWGFYAAFAPEELVGSGATFDLTLAVQAVSGPGVLVT